MKMTVRFDRQVFLARALGPEATLDVQPLTGERLSAAEASSEPWLLVVAPNVEEAHGVAVLAWRAERGWKGMHVALELNPRKFGEVVGHPSVTTPPEASA